LRAEQSAGSFLARKFSRSLAEVEQELAKIEADLPSLPQIPASDQGGTGGFSIFQAASASQVGSDSSVTIHFRDPGDVDLVALIPARRYGVSGLNPQFGMPDAFSVCLIDEKGDEVLKIAEVEKTWSNPVRAGHPYLFEISPPVRAAGLKVVASALQLDPEVSDSYVHAWAEAFAFQKEHNLAQNARIESTGGLPPPAPWQWANDYLVDGQTPLGLPEMPGEHHQNVGWMSDAKASKGSEVWFDINFGELRTFDAVRLFPAKRPTSDLPSGFGFPKTFIVSVWEGSPADQTRSPIFQKRVETANPGHNPFTVPLGPCRGSYLRVEMVELWKAFEKFPAFAALSEVQVLEGDENRAIGAGVETSASIGTVISSGSQYWSPSSLTDGFGPDGRLVSSRSWLQALDRRLDLESRQFQLKLARQEITQLWGRVLWSFVAVLGGAGLIVLIALPIRYRLREKRQMEAVRDRIAGDLHDEVGSNLGSIQMFADLAERRKGASNELKNIQRIAAETVSAVRDIVWLLKPGADHRIATVEHLRETCSIMLESYSWDFTANEEAWSCEMSDEANRHLFLYLREALHNILRHSEADRVKLQVEVHSGNLGLVISDNGRGIDPEKLERPATLRALRKRAEALQAEFRVSSKPSEGTELRLEIPLRGKTAAVSK